MTTDERIQIHIDRIERLNRFLRLAHLGRRSKESAVARKVRRNLIGDIEEMLNYERAKLKQDLEYFAATTPAERKEDEDTFQGGWSDYFADDFDGLALLDAAPTSRKDGKAFDPATCRWYYVEESYPRKVTVTVVELGDLAALIEQIKAELAIPFTVERVFWTEDSLAHWVFAEEMRDAGARGHAG